MLTLKPLFRPKPSRIELRARLRAASTVFYQCCLPFPVFASLLLACGERVLFYFVLFHFVWGHGELPNTSLWKRKSLKSLSSRTPTQCWTSSFPDKKISSARRRLPAIIRLGRQSRLHPRLFWLPGLLNGRTKGCGLKIECQHCLRAKTKHPRILYRGTQSLTMICSRP